MGHGHWRGRLRSAWECEPLFRMRSCWKAMGTVQWRRFTAANLPPPSALGGRRVRYPRQSVRRRKNLKVMSRDIQLGVSAAELTCTEGGIEVPACGNSDRVGVVRSGTRSATELPRVVADAWRACMLDGRFHIPR